MTEQLKNSKAQRDELVTRNMGYVVTLARQYKSDMLTTDDLVSEGTIGIIRAAERYDASRGKPFVTFAAPYIRRAIEEAIARLTGEAPVLSTDESLPVGSQNNFTLLNVLEDPNAPRADASVEADALDDAMVDALGLLADREQTVLRHYYGIGGTDRLTMAEIADLMGLKRERVRQIRDTALRHLRRTAKS